MTSEELPPFSWGVRLGLVFIVQAACISLTAVTGLLLYLGCTILKVRRRALGSQTWSIAETDVHYYLLNLLLADIVQAVGGIMNIRWIDGARVIEGPFCTAQGMIKQMGDLGVSLTSLIIAVHTFKVLVFRRSSPRGIALLLLSALWIFIGLVVGVSYAIHKQGYYGDTQYWCWITDRFPVQQIVLDYLWMWIAAFCNTIIYIFLALVINGIVVVDNGRNLFPDREQRDMRRMILNSASENRSGAIARQMLFYPAVYIFTALPIAVSRFQAFHSHHVPFAITAFSDVLFSSSGVLNVILFAVTRPALFPRRNINVAVGAPGLERYRTATSTRERDKGHLSNEVIVERTFPSTWPTSIRWSRTTVNHSPLSPIPPVHHHSDDFMDY